ncbi:MAG: DUF2085 domain-containing protein [Clostridiales bacterium]|nr:DUF2085 domain-containing protein [Clostridiales bacterium]
MENVTTEKRNMSAEKITRADRIWLRLMDIGGHLGCHQLESHSFSIGGYQMPLCARCTGILLGDVFGIAMILFGIRLPWLWCALALVVMAMDWGFQYLKMTMSNNPRRLVTGAFCGIACMFGAFYVIRFLILLVS